MTGRAKEIVEEIQQDPKKAFRKGKDKVDGLVQEASRIAPSNAFVIGSLASIAVSAFLFLFGKQKAALFVGQWAPTFMLYGLFNKLTKKFGPA